MLLIDVKFVSFGSGICAVKRNFQTSPDPQRLVLSLQGDRRQAFLEKRVAFLLVPYLVALLMSLCVTQWGQDNEWGQAGIGNWLASDRPGS